MADLHCQIQISIPILIWAAYQMATLYGAEYCTESVSDSHPSRGMGLESGSELFSVSLKTLHLLYLINSGNQFIHAVNFARWNGNLKFNPVHLLLNTLKKNCLTTDHSLEVGLFGDTSELEIEHGGVRLLGARLIQNIQSQIIWLPIWSTNLQAHK